VNGKSGPSPAERLREVCALIADGLGRIPAQPDTPGARAWFVYILECAGSRLYTGIAVDVQARLVAHQSGKGARYTRMHAPETLLAKFVFPDRASASRAEAAIKRLNAGQKRRLLAPNVAGDQRSPVDDSSE